MSETQCATFDARSVHQSLVKLTSKNIRAFSQNGYITERSATVGFVARELLYKTVYVVSERRCQNFALYRKHCQKRHSSSKGPDFSRRFTRNFARTNGDSLPAYVDASKRRCLAESSVSSSVRLRSYRKDWWGSKIRSSFLLWKELDYIQELLA